MSSLAPDFTPYPTLWALGAIAQQLPPLPYEPQSGLEEAAVPLASWYRICYYMNHEPHSRNLKARLSQEHLVSFQLLHEWWTAAYQDRAISVSAWSRIVGGAGIDLDAGGREGEGVRDFLKGHLHLDWAGRCEPVVGDSSVYHKTMLELIDFEFGHDSCYDRHEATSEILDGRRGVRWEIAQYAYVQAVGWNLYRQGLSGDQSRKPRTRDGCSGDWAFLDEPSNAFLARGPVFNPCPWLEEDYDELGNMPYYLWDVQRGRTVVTAELESKPKYVAISHTWGRWVISQPITVEGVPWKVPQNSRFEVERLADILSQVPGGLEYVWFDLVCIPQDGSAIGAREIARQAKIFRGATYAIAWLNSLESTDGLFSGMAWKALQSLTVNSNDAKRDLNRVVKKAWKSFTKHGSGLFSPRPQRWNIPDWSLNPWFTSLWTLQEVCLRPDMWLCARDWSYLSSDGLVPVTMSGFVAIANTIDTLPQSKWNIAYTELNNWRRTTGLQTLLDLDQVSILSLGDRRECSGRRAEAIMSVLGATQWYTDALQHSSIKDLEQDLVLGKYPIEFVNELAFKMPGSFFATFDKSRFFPKDTGTQTGSMLPFSRDRTVYTLASAHMYLGYTAQPVPSVKTWHVLKDGTVRIPRASIVSSKTMPASLLSRIIPSKLYGRLVSGDQVPLQEDLESSSGIPYEKDDWTDLHRWILSRPGEAYAVLMQFHHRMRQDTIVWTTLTGVILERDGSGPLSKTGNFILYDEEQGIDYEGADDVDWVVC